MPDNNTINSQVIPNINNNIINSIADQPNNIVNTTVKHGKTPHKGHLWKKGETGNPKGRPKKPIIDDLYVALKRVEKKEQKTFLQHIVERSFINDTVAIALAKKLIPDLSSVNTELSMKGFRLVIERTADNKVEMEGK